MAALRGGIKTVLIPIENQRELVEIPKNIKQGLEIQPVRWIDEVWQLALQRMPQPLPIETTDGNLKQDPPEEEDTIRAH